jgi:transposase
VIERHFGVRYHPDHIGRLLHALGWTPRSRSGAPSSATRPPSLGGSGRSGPG